MNKQISKYLNSGKYDFKLFNINYTEKEQECINKIKINVDNDFDDYSYYGSINKISGINTFLLKIGNNTKEEIDKLEKIILKLLKKVLDGYQTEYFWMDIRVSSPSNDFDSPRWHQDGPYFDRTIITSKFVTTLKGPGTLLIKSTKKVSNIYNTIRDTIYKEIRKTNNQDEQIKIHHKYRPIYADKLKNEKIIQVKNNQGVIFYANSGGIDGAIHSEPKVDDNRIFISILPGTKENIESLKKKWKH
jgi:hypothetical protein